jgi:acetyl esterase/lipase
MQIKRLRVALCGFALFGLLGCSSSSTPEADQSSGGGTPGGAGSAGSGVVSAAGATTTGSSGAASSNGGAGTGVGGAVGASGGPSSAGGTGTSAGAVGYGGSSGATSAGGATSTGGVAGSTSSGAAGTAGAAGAAPITPPVKDTTSTLAIASGGSGYKVDGNVIYGPLSTQRLDVIYPNNAGPNGTVTLPGVIMFHGGGWIEDHKANIQSFVQAFLAHGFIVCTVEYRLADGTATGAIAPAAVEDALLSAKWFWDHLDYYHIDKTKYVVTGGSAGGHLALMVGMATSAAQAGPVNPTDYKIAAIVDGYGPTDITDLLKRGTSFAVQWLPANTPDRAAIAVRMSPVSYVRADIPPMIAVQGSNDTTVPVVQSQTLVAALQAAGAEASIHLVPGAGHGFSTPAGAWTDAQGAMFGFLTQHGIGK